MSKNSFAYVDVHIEGIAPMMMHNGGLADPTNYWAKEIKKYSSKRKKTDDDHWKLKELEFKGGLYFDDNTGPYIPDTWIEKNIRDGAAEFKQGKLILSGVVCTEEKIKLIYDGPEDPDEMFKDARFVDTRGVVVQRQRIMRTRPKFPAWEAKFQLQILKEVISPNDVERALDKAGLLKGLGDYRPKYGRYVVKGFQEK